MPTVHSALGGLRDRVCRPRFLRPLTVAHTRELPGSTQRDDAVVPGSCPGRRTKQALCVAHEARAHGAWPSDEPPMDMPLHLPLPIGRWRVPQRSSAACWPNLETPSPGQPPLPLPVILFRGLTRSDHDRKQALAAARRPTNSPARRRQKARCSPARGHSLALYPIWLKVNKMHSEVLVKDNSTDGSGNLVNARQRKGS